MEISQLKPIEINLLREEKRRSGASILAALLAGIVIGGILVPGWFWYEAKGKIADFTSRIAQSNEQQLQLEQRLQAVSSEVDLHLALTLPERLQQTYPRATEWLLALTAILPREANVDGIVYSSDGRIQLNAAFASTEQVVTLINEIERIGVFKLISLGSLSNQPADDPEAPGVEGTELPITRTLIELEYQPSSSSETGGST